MSFVERFITLCPYVRESTIAGSTVIVQEYSQMSSTINFN